MRGICIAVLIAAAVLMARAAIPAEVQTLLQARLGWSNAEFAQLDGNRPVARSLGSGQPRVLAAAGAVRVAVPVDFFVVRFTDIVAFKRSPIVRQIGKFSEPPNLDDLQRLGFEGGDLDALRKCRVGDCALNLSAAQIAQVRARVDWRRADWRVRANQVLRELLLEYVRAYRRSGHRALIAYENDDEPIDLRQEASVLVAESERQLQGVPEFRDYLLGNGPLPGGADEFIYWSNEQFGLKPVVSITHVVIYRPRRAGAADAVIASKQIYASRYLSGSLAVTLAVEPSSAAQQFYMIYVNRTRPRSFPPIIGGIVRRVAQGRMRDGLEEQLQLAKERLEADFGRRSSAR